MEKNRQRDIAVRAAYSGHSTRDIKKAKELMAAEDLNLDELEAIQDRLTRHLVELEEQDNKIRMSIEEKRPRTRYEGDGRSSCKR